MSWRGLHISKEGRNIMKGVRGGGGVDEKRERDWYTFLHYAKVSCQTFNLLLQGCTMWSFLSYVISKGKQDFLVTVYGKITFFELCLNVLYIYHTTLKYDKSNLHNILFFSDIKENCSNKWSDCYKLLRYWKHYINGWTFDTVLLC